MVATIAVSFATLRYLLHTPVSSGGWGDILPHEGNDEGEPKEKAAAAAAVA